MNMFSNASFLSRANADAAAIGLSVVCLIHCLVLPVALVLFPSVLVSYFAQEWVHQLAVMFAVPVSIFALTMGCGSHKRIWILALGVLGIAILLFPLLVGTEALETPMTIVGASIIAASHIANMRTCRSLDCHSPS